MLCCCFIISLVFLASVECRTVYIATSGAVCPIASRASNSCMTLTQIAASSKAAPTTESNLTIIFLPGNHTLNATNFSFTMIPHVSMKSQSRDGFSRYAINCYKSSKLQFRFNSLVHISGLTLNECYEIEVYQVKEFVMEDCRLSGRERSFGRGRGLVVTKSTLKIMRTDFMSFHGNATHKGGAVYCWQTNISLSDCMFMNNSATSGAAVYIEEDSTLISLNCSFSNHIVCIDNDTDIIYGVVYANLSSVILCNSDFSNNSFYHGNLTTNNGGVLSAFRSNVSISECTFIGNIAFNGGVAYCHRGAKLMISSTNFIENKAVNYGGVILQLNCDVHINGSNFSRNSGKLGGVLYHTAKRSVDELSIKGSNFHYNSARRGGILYYVYGTTKIDKCRFSFNMASDQGGCLFFTFSNAIIFDSRFRNNRARTLGGALRAMNDSHVYILMSALFENNSAFYGAAIHLYRAEELQLNGTISIISNKGSLGTVGVINSKASFYGAISFVDNVGSLFAFGSYIYFDGTITFSGHKVESLANDYYNNTLEKKEGGCITLLLTKMSILHSGILSLKRSTAINGGGILAISSNIDVLDSNLVVLGNNATDTGGGIYIYQSKLYIRGSANISNNRAKNFGGGVHAISSMIVLHIQRTDRVHLYLQSNVAERGGSACLELNSKFFVTQLLIRSKTK